MTPTAEALISRRIASFAATLRGAGFAAGLRESEDAARVLASPLALRQATLRPALRALFAANRSEWERFDALFDAAFLGRRLRSVVRSHGALPRPGPRSLRELAAARQQDSSPSAPEATAPGAGDADAGMPAGMRDGASAADSRAAENLGSVSDDGADATAAQLWAALRTRRSRRHRRVRHGQRLDLRRTIRASLEHGGMPFQLAWRRKRHKRLRVALLLDVSGSMSLYTPMFVRLARGMLRDNAPAEAFMFHTRLIEISQALRDRDRQRALDKLTLLAGGVGGGTRIADSLASFNRAHAARALAGRAVCFIVSDGYETGDPARLGHAMAALRRRCRRIVWLNPMAVSAGYAPVARGMQVAMPYLRIFAPAASLEGVSALVPQLARL